MENDTDIREQLFHNTVRENVVSIFFFNSNSMLSYFKCLLSAGVFVPI